MKENLMRINILLLSLLLYSTSIHSESLDTISIVQGMGIFKNHEYIQGAPPKNITGEIEYILALDQEAIRYFKCSEVTIKSMPTLLTFGFSLLVLNSLIFKKPESQEDMNMSRALKIAGISSFCICLPLPIISRLLAKKSIRIYNLNVIMPSS